MDKKLKKRLNSSRKRRERALKKNNPEMYETKKREEEYLKASMNRLKEYDINRKRDKNDPLWEHDGHNNM